MLTLLPLLALAAPLSGGALPSAAPPPPPVPHFAVADEWQELLDGYEAAVAEWKQKIADEEDKSVRSKLRKENPATAWWPRFETAAGAGEGRALLWMAQRVRDKRVKRAEASEVKERMYAALAEKYAAAAWFGEVFEGLPREEKYISFESYTNVCEAAIEQNEVADVRAAAMVTLGTFLREADDEASQAEGLVWLQRVQREFPGTKWATSALSATIRAEDLQPGKLAPDFAASTIDGHDFKLSDYRGKVVLIDFYGFW